MFRFKKHKLAILLYDFNKGQGYVAKTQNRIEMYDIRALNEEPRIYYFKHEITHFKNSVDDNSAVTSSLF